MIKFLKMQSAHWRAMLQHVSECAPLEACGLLAGKQDSVKAVLKVRNAEQSPVRFRMDPQEQYNALMWIETNGLDLVGIFHSHPSGPNTVSPTDIAEVAYEVVQIIWSRSNGTWNMRGFWIESGQVTEITLQLMNEQ
jgi:[CysO sulfur-carrier protein]-S-L-cysteine hydrolase